jgi:drug/metabolite transporter (DMT)-like permease
MVLFGETHSPWVWASVATMIIGLALVTPRKTAAPLAPAPDSPTGL